jgi:LysM repeat protein
LAQGILESGNGNSMLAKHAKNHFGIKCHSTRRGDTFFQDDDKANECFRSYVSAAESYRDHSLFLKRKRYARLFELKMTDYKGWAKGLKACGYATNPKYAHLLIDIIERYSLDKFDKMPNLAKDIEQEEELTTTTSSYKPSVDIKPKPVVESTEIVFDINASKHSKKISSNKVSYIVIKKGDTFYRISKEFDMALGQLYKYNEFSKKDVLKVGDIVYLSPKKGRSQKGNPIHVCKKELSLRDIAHIEGIRLKKLLKFNLMDDPDKKLPKGTKVILR